MDATKMSFSGCMKKQWHTQSNLGVKRNELSRQEKAKKNLQCALMSERSQSQRAIYCKIPTIWHSWKKQNTKLVERPVVAQVEVNRHHLTGF